MTPALATRWLPTTPPTPCPDLLTPGEAAAYLRLDNDGSDRTLERLRNEGKLRGVKISRTIMYPIAELERFVRALWDEQHTGIDWPTPT